MHLSTETLAHLLDTWGYFAVFLFVAIESTGIPFPGETMLVTASVYAAGGHLNIMVVIAAGALGAILGDNTGYLIGREGGRAVILKFGKFFHLDQKRMGSAEAFFKRHGDKTVFLGRFVAVLRAWVAFLAGLNRMPWPTFLVFNAAGGIVWSILFGMLGFLLGRNIALLHKVLRDVGVGSFILAAAVIAVIFLLHRRRQTYRREEHQAEKGSTSGA